MHQHTLVSNMDSVKGRQKLMDAFLQTKFCSWLQINIFSSFQGLPSF